MVFSGHSCYSLQLQLFPFPSSTAFSPWVVDREVDIKVLFKDEHSTTIVLSITCILESLHLSQFTCKEASLIKDQVAFVYVYKFTYLEGSSARCQSPTS